MAISKPPPASFSTALLLHTPFLVNLHFRGFDVYSHSQLGEMHYVLPCWLRKQAEICIYSSKRQGRDPGGTWAPQALELGWQHLICPNIHQWEERWKSLSKSCRRGLKASYPWLACPWHTGRCSLETGYDAGMGWGQHKHQEEWRVQSPGGWYL